MLGKIRFKFVERAGVCLKSLLQKSDPWAGGSCGDDKCFACKGEKGGNCRRSNVTYQVVCGECTDHDVVAQYKGETGRNMYTRGLKHQSELRNKTKDSALWSHCQEYHDSVEVPFFMQQTGAFRDSLSRQIMEGCK